jgi:hypothetical protein
LRPGRHGFTAVLGTLALWSCGVLPGIGPTVHLDNFTNTPLAVRVKGGWVGTYAPGSSVEVPLAGRGDPPFAVTVHSPSGRILMQLEVSADALEMAADDRGSMGGSADLDCGTIWLSVGQSRDAPPAGPVAQLPPCP